MLYRDALFAAVHNVNANILPLLQKSSDPTSPIRIADFFEMSASPDARWHSDAHHYAPAVRVSMIIQLLRANTTAPSPPPSKTSRT